MLRAATQQVEQRAEEVYQLHPWRVSVWTLARVFTAESWDSLTHWVSLNPGTTSAAGTALSTPLASTGDPASRPASLAAPPPPEPTPPPEPGAAHAFGAAARRESGRARRSLHGNRYPTRGARRERKPRLGKWDPAATLVRSPRGRHPRQPQACYVRLAPVGGGSFRATRFDQCERARRGGRARGC